MQALISAAADLLLGATCPGCDAPGLGWCPACLKALRAPAFCLDRGLGLPVAAAANYRPVLCRAIPRFKDDGGLHLGGPLGRLLARAVEHLDPPRETQLVPVPSLPCAVRARGYDHGLCLARVAARSTGLMARRGLTRKRQGSDQHGLSRAARAANLAGSMRAVGPAGTVVVVDDVVTTGASLREAIRALTAAGFVVWGAAVIANADRSANPKPTRFDTR